MDRMTSRVACECSQRDEKQPHHWHQPSEQGLPLRICCFCGVVIAEATDVKEGCGPYVMAPEPVRLSAER